MEATAAGLARYFGRIGYTGPREPVLATLASLQLHHILALPFENLDPLLQRPVRLDLPSLEDKLLGQGRGGYCYEQNILLMAMLTRLGFAVTGLAARVLWNAPPGTVRARTHMLLKVDLPQGAYLVDAGFGGMTPTAPLALIPDLPQATPHEHFRLLQESGALLRLEAQVHDRWLPVYSFDLQPQLLPDYEAANWYVSTHPSSPFVHVLRASRVTPTGRHVLQGNQLAHHPSPSSGAVSDKRRLGSPAALRQALAEIFRIRLPAGSALDAVLAQQSQAPPA